MKKQKHLFTLVLMLSSILLLLVLQFFWIKREYSNAEQSFRKESNLLFRATMHGILDSLFMTSIEFSGSDGAKFFPTDRSQHRFRRPYYMSENGQKADSVVNTINLKERYAKVEVYSNTQSDISLRADSLKMEINHPKNQQAFKLISGQDSSVKLNRDSVNKLMMPLLKKMESAKVNMNSVLIRLHPDSIPQDSIRAKFLQQLTETKIPHNFSIIIKNGEGIITQGDTGLFVTDFFRISPDFRYAVAFDDIQWLLIKDIAPQISFSVVLTLLTLLAFIVMYKSLMEQQRLITQKNEFISNVSHELKTPVATVSVALEALQSFNALNNPEQTKEYLSMAQSELKRLSLMTDKILKTAIYDTKGIEIEAENIDLKELVEQICNSMKLLWDKQKVITEIHLTGSDFQLLGSQVHISNVIYNLLDNAVKYSPQAAHIIIQLKEEADTITLSIKDHGMGIPEEYLDKIFDKFFRVPQGDVHNIKGYGLGLSYVASVIKAHKGKISVNSRKQQGCEFIIKLPKRYGKH